MSSTPVPPLKPLKPLSQGNGLQRAYARWAEPYYQRLEPGPRERLELIDRWLYSRSGVGFWLAVLGALLGCTWGLRSTGLPWWIAISAGLLLCIFLPLIALSVWWMPANFTGPKALRTARWVLPLAAVSALPGYMVGHLSRHGWDSWGLLVQRLSDIVVVLAPAALLFSAALVGLIWGGARLREQVLQRQLDQSRLQQERDAARSQAVQAQLQLLQGQIQPHFIFNTLSALQHWVDVGDARAGPLLRSLTAFLRGSTDLLGRDETSLADELALASHYLEVMATRLGPRLQWQMDIAGELSGLRLPPGLLLTLVENAIEHGVSRSLHGAELRISAVAQGPRAVLRVSDTAALWHAAAAEGVGLRNTRQRLSHRWGQAAELLITCDGAQTVAQLSLPWAPLPDTAPPVT